MNIPFADLPAQYRSLRPEIDEAIRNILDTGQYIQGEAVSRFEDAFAAHHRSKYCVAVGSGTDALHVALWAMGIGRDDIVLTVPYTFIATAETVLLTGARPVFVDIDPQTFNMDPAGLEAALKKNPKARVVLPVHLYGQPAPMDAIMELAKRHGAEVLEDAAQAHGARQGGTFVGNFGRAGTFSFYPAKNLGAFGEAGAVTTNDDRLATLMRRLRDHGQVEKYRHAQIGQTYRMDGLQGAVLGVKLRSLREWTAKRRELAATYREALSGVGDLVLPVDAPGTEHVYHLFVVRSAHREALRSFLREQGITTALHYPVPLHLQEALRFLGYREGDFPASEAASRESLAIPLYPELQPAQVEFLLTTIREFFSR